MNRCDAIPVFSRTDTPDRCTLPAGHTGKHRAAYRTLPNGGGVTVTFTT